MKLNKAALDWKANMERVLSSRDESIVDINCIRLDGTTRTESIPTRILEVLEDQDGNLPQVLVEVDDPTKGKKLDD